MVCICSSLQVLGIKLPNIFGRGEKVTFQFSYGTKETSYGLSFFKPQPGYFERKYDPRPWLIILRQTSAGKNVSLTKFPFCSFMQFCTKSLQSHWPVSVEFTEGDWQGSFHRTQCKLSISSVWFVSCVCTVMTGGTGVSQLPGPRYEPEL